MKYIRKYNSMKMEELPGWATSCRSKSIDIIDDKNGFAFCIQFGKKPEIVVYRDSDKDNFGKRVFFKKINKNDR